VSINQNLALTAEVRGGLGNQLFIYCAGAFLCEKLGKTLVLNMETATKGIALHGDSILSMTPLASDSNFSPRKLSQVSKLQFKFSREYKNTPNAIIDRLRYFESNNLGYDDRLDHLSSVRYLKGYFQSYRYYDYLIKNGSKYLNFVLPSLPGELEEYAEIAKAPNSIAIHVRQGDYRNFSETHGLLSKGYYEEAIAAIIARSELNNPKIFAFTDDLENAKRALQGFYYDLRWVNPSLEVRSSQILHLYSKFSNKVIANSTFSWWGAQLGTKESCIVAPSKWFRNLDDPIDLVPPNWLRTVSEWIE
jgi:hypothetical protein